jgi:hypothetical protein
VGEDLGIRPRPMCGAPTGVPDAGIGEAEWLPGGPVATVLAVGSNGLNRFPNLNGSEMFIFFKLLSTQK